MKYTVLFSQMTFRIIILKSAVETEDAQLFISLFNSVAQLYLKTWYSEFISSQSLHNFN